MSLQTPRPFPVTWATGSTFSNSIDLGGGYLYISIEIPANLNNMFGAATPFYLNVSSDNVTFRRYMEPLTSTVSNDFSIASSVSNRMVGVPYVGNRYVKLEASATATTPVAGFKIICTDSL